jgi:AcrR family transcriptional regulator
VADSIEYSPSIVYEYFASKDDILHALLQDGFRELAASMGRAQRSTDDPDRQVAHVTDAYWYFARENTDLYQVMHGLAGVTTDPAVRADALQGVAATAADTLVTWATANNVHLDDPIANAEIVWSLLHGWVSLTLIDGVYPDQDRAQRLLHQAVDALLQGWRAAGPTV